MAMNPSQQQLFMSSTSIRKHTKAATAQHQHEPARQRHA